MGMNDYLKCPGLEHTLSIIPENVACPACGNGVEIWSDERKRRCSNCNVMVKNSNYKYDDITKFSFHEPGEQERALDELRHHALRSGVSGAAFISPNEISVEEELARLCQTPGCVNYGLSASCPPNVAGPIGFRQVIEKNDHALVVKIDVPMDILLSPERCDIMKLLHEIVAHAERSVVKMGFIHSRAFAGGSCKKIFCTDHLECRVLSGDGTCRHPQSARPSMSGFGINVSGLMQSAGWRLNTPYGEDDTDAESMGAVCGLVLIG